MYDNKNAAAADCLGRRYLVSKIKRIMSDIIKYFTLILMSLIFILPILTIILGAFKGHNEFYTMSKLAMPQNLANVSNFKTAFIDGGMLNGFKNTVIILAFSLTGSILFGAMVGYVMSRFDFWGKKLIMGLFFAAMLIPMVTTQVATYQIVTHLHLVGTIWSAIVLYLGADVMSIYIMMQFVDCLPTSIDESAMLDGASYFTIFFRCILPNLKPAIATIAIIRGVAIYNDFYIPFLYMPDMSLGTMSTSLFRFKGPYGSSWEVICAGVILVMIPTLIAFLALQKYIYNGFTSGSVKG